MEELAHPAGWTEALGWFSLSVAFACALVILADLFLLGRRQHMWIMNLVYPVPALYWGPVGLWLYFVHGRRTLRRAVENAACLTPTSCRTRTSSPRDGGRQRLAGTVTAVRLLARLAGGGA
ncbi:hypothetical protein [Streptomyces albogriseolus]|uniref:hypothetical protein n=1 Tax=Streptomyces albogriseolus TaxID=1887 RepID=UPI003D737393